MYTVQYCIKIIVIVKDTSGKVPRVNIYPTAKQKERSVCYKSYNSYKEYYKKVVLWINNENVW